MPLQASPIAQPQYAPQSSKDCPSVSAVIRAAGYDCLPDTYFLNGFPRFLHHIKKGMQLWILVGHEPHVSSYKITLDRVLIIGKDVVQFLALCPSFAPHGLCYIQVPAARAQVSRLGVLLDLLRATGNRRAHTFPDSIPPRAILGTPAIQSAGQTCNATAMRATSSAQGATSPRGKSVEIVMDVVTSVHDKA
ncbi:hypothetical protein C8Q78DRAFT_1077542 [Trametes maxima]|nr:hypothetical protein C8Q78DRAFT_1077542 [Trametes maxima]